jgi:hypothetical protein
MALGLALSLWSCGNEVSDPRKSASGHGLRNSDQSSDVKKDDIDPLPKDDGGNSDTVDIPDWIDGTYLACANPGSEDMTTTLSCSFKDSKTKTILTKLPEALDYKLTVLKDNIQVSELVRNQSENIFSTQISTADLASLDINYEISKKVSSIDSPAGLPNSGDPTKENTAANPDDATPKTYTFRKALSDLFNP